MPQIELGTRIMGAWNLAPDLDGNIGACVVTVNYSVMVDGEAVAGLSDTYDVWPELTEGQRHQLQNIVDRVQEVCEV